MHRLFKWLLAIIGTLVLLLVIAAVVLPLTFDPNNYKEEIQQSVKQETGRDLSIAGDIEWTVFPWLGFEVNDITLGNRQGFGDEPMLVVGEAGASVKLMPLISRQVEIGNITLKNLSVRLSRKANGENNWDDLNEAGDQESSADTAGDSTGDSGKNTPMGSVKISGVEISNANVRWDDAGQITELSNASLNVSGISDRQPFDLDGGFSIALTEPALSGDVRFGGKVVPDSGNDALRIENLILTLQGQQGSTSDALVVDIEIAANAIIDEENDTTSLNDFRFRLHNMTATGDLIVSSTSRDSAVKGTLNVAEFSPKTLLEKLGQDVPVTSNRDALTKLSAQMKFAGTTNEANLQGLNLQLDESIFTGRFKVRDFSTPNLDFELAIDSLNLDDYLPPADESTAAPSPTAVLESGQVSGVTGSRHSDTDLRAEDFRAYTGGGSFKIGKLVIAGLTATNVSTTMSANADGWRFYPTVADFYGGKNQSDIRIDASGNRPVLIISEDLSGVQAEGLLSDFTGEASRLLGTGSLMLNLRADLSNSSSLRNTLSGDLNLKLLDGAFVGIDVADTITQAKNLLGKQDKSTESLDDRAKTEFAQMSLSGLINNGILTSNDFTMSSTLLTASGEGQINLVNETIDYLVQPVLSENVRGQGKSVRGQLSGIPIPIRINGSLYDPKISVDILAAVTDSQKAKIDEKKTELTNKLFDKLLGTDKDKPAEEQTKDGQSTGQDVTAGEQTNNNDQSSEKDSQQDSAKVLIDSLFGSKKDKKKKNSAEDPPEDNATDPDT